MRSNIGHCFSCGRSDVEVTDEGEESRCWSGCRARLDENRTAIPKTRLSSGVEVDPNATCARSLTAPGADTLVTEDGTRIALKPSTVCSDTRAGDMLVVCECGQYRPWDVTHGFVRQDI